MREHLSCFVKTYLLKWNDQPLTFVSYEISLKKFKLLMVGLNASSFIHQSYLSKIRQREELGILLVYTPD